MKNTDIAMIIFVAAISGGLAFGLLSAIPGLKLTDDPVKVQKIDKYSAEVVEPDKEIFNKTAINPTVDITIGRDSSDDLVDITSDE